MRSLFHRYAGSQRMAPAGFTLIELMIVIVIVAILMTIAYPSYTQYVIRSRRSDGQTGLMNAAQAEEKFFYRCNAYGALGQIYGSAAPSCTTGSSDNTPSPQAYYTISFSALSATAYTLTATPIGVQAIDTRCGVLSINNLGVKAASGDPAFNTDGDAYRCWH